MKYTWTRLPLYDSWDYSYNIPIGTKSVDLRIYYSDRTQHWSFDASYAEGESILQGVALIPLEPMLEFAIEGVNGFMWLEPISADINESASHPDMLYKYFNLYYIHWDDEEQRTEV